MLSTSIDAGVPLRDVREAASHADPRTTMRYDRARTSLDRHATYIVAAFVSRGRPGSWSVPRFNGPPRCKRPGQLGVPEAPCQNHEPPYLHRSSAARGFRGRTLILLPVPLIAAGFCEPGRPG